MRIFKKNGGFTLVELIVVIAILAILAGVAIPAYSGYVTKANKTADRTLISDVADALVLYCYSNPNAVEEANGVAMVAIDTNGKVKVTGFGDEAMKAVFGANWAETVKLKYDQWNSGITDVLERYTQDELDLINNSTFLTSTTTDSMLGTVNVLTNMAADVIEAKKYDKDGVALRLKLVLGNTPATQEVIDKLDSQNLLNDPTAISNMLVGAMADSVDANPVLKQVITEYSAAFAYAQKESDFAAYNKMTENLGKMTVSLLIKDGEETDDDAVLNALGKLYEGFDGPEYNGFTSYLDANLNNTVESDKDALVAMMTAVKGIAGNFEDKASLKNENLFTSSDMVGQVDGYINAVKTLGAMTAAERDALLADLPEEAVAVLIGADGSVIVWPGNAWIG